MISTAEFVMAMARMDNPDGTISFSGVQFQIGARTVDVSDDEFANYVVYKHKTNRTRD